MIPLSIRSEAREGARGCLVGIECDSSCHPSVLEMSDTPSTILKSMPIPQTEETTGPRRLLRYVVFDKMLAAIVDGTLEPGERLNDDQLVEWLGVSRTPTQAAVKL